MSERPIHVDPLRRHLHLTNRSQWLRERQAELRVEIADIDAQIDELRQRRTRCTTERSANRAQLIEPFRVLGRQPDLDGHAVLPPIDTDAELLWGRALRRRCRELLRQHGALPLRELHALLHLRGYAVSHRHAVKTLAEAMAYEVRLGRVVRVERGVYAPAPK